MDGIFRDVYDGNVWKDFQYCDDKPFLSEEEKFALMMNMDFFNLINTFSIPTESSPGC